MRETGSRDLHRTDSAETIPEFLARNMRSAVVQRLAARNIIFIAAAAALVFGMNLYFGTSTTSAERANHDRPNHGNDLANTRFQNLDQINLGNVNKLQVAWVFHTGVLDPLSELEASPIEVGGCLFITDGHDDVFALNAAPEQQLWKFAGFNDQAQLANFFLCCGRNNHSVTYGEGMVFEPQRGYRFDSRIGLGCCGHLERGSGTTWRDRLLSHREHGLARTAVENEVLSGLTTMAERAVNAFGGNVPDRSITANGNCLGGGHTCDNPFGDAFIAFALRR